MFFNMFAGPGGGSRVVFSGEGMDGIDISEIFQSVGLRGMGGGMGGMNRMGTQSQGRGILKPGEVVLVHGLTKAREHNGKRGHIKGFDASRGRYEVRLDQVDEVVIHVRQENLTQQCSVKVEGLTSKPELNGRTGEIIGFDPHKGRYSVLLQGGQDLGDASALVSLQGKHCILKTGTCIRLHGLSKAELNGCRGEILEIDVPAGRYQVHLQNGKQIKVKFENVLF
eukprot:Skav211797  [mRNA]  locus=scaffold305:325580:326254:+ [translate_table: standard]